MYKMILKLAIYVTAIAGVTATAIFFIYRGPAASSVYTGHRKVAISTIGDRFTFVKDGKPMLVKGGAGYTNLKELAACGGNTIMCWNLPKLDSVFAEAKKYNINVIIGLNLPGGDNADFYNNKRNVDSVFTAQKQLVMRYHNNPMLLAWCLGNELSIPFSFTGNDFFKTYNSLLAMIHTIDPNHPVSTAVMNIPKRHLFNIQWRIRSLDFICINTYNNLKIIEQDLNRLKRMWSGPYLVGEWAPNGGWEAKLTTWEAPIENTSTKKAEQFYDLYKKYMPVKDNRFLGSLAFYWGNRYEYTDTWFSIFSEDGKSTEVAEVLHDCWSDTLTSHNAPKLQYMLIDSLGAADNIIVSPGSVHEAAVILDTTSLAGDMYYKWEVIKEDWPSWGTTWRGFKKPLAESGLIADSSGQFSNFKAPLKQGPYRVFVTVYNSKGYCATANTPIYVTE